MIKIVSITKEQKIYFMGMDPLMLMDRLDLAGMFALGAVSEDEKTHEVVPVGLMVCEEGRNCYRIHWLCVDVDYRTRGIGTELLTAVFEAAMRKEYPYVEAHVVQVPDREGFCSAEDHYLRDHLFGRRRELPGEWHTDIQRLSRTFERIRIPEGSTIRGLGELGLEERRLVLTKLVNLKHQTGRKCIWRHEELFDPYLSRICYRGGRVTGGLLVQKVAVTDPELRDGETIPSEEKVLYPIYLSSVGELDAVSLIADACREGKKRYPEHTKICVISHTEALRDFYDRLMPGCHVNSYKLIAEVKNYRQADEHVGEYYIL